MLHVDGHDRPGRYRCLTAPVEPRVWQRDGTPGRSSFFFAWSGARRRDRSREPTPNLGLEQDSTSVGVSIEAILPSRGRGTKARLTLAAAKATWDEDDEDDAILSISRTALFDRTRRESDPARYVETTEIPFLTLSIHKTFRAIGVALGDFATVIHARTGRLAHAIVGDGQHVPGVEPSLFLAEAVDLSPGDEAIYLIHPRSGSGQGTIPPNAQIDSSGERLFRLPPANSPVAWDVILADAFREKLAPCPLQRVR